MEGVGASFSLDQLQTLMKGGTAHWTKTVVFFKKFHIQFIKSRSFYIAIQYMYCRYIDLKYYNILSCLIFHPNLVIICSADGRIQPTIVPIVLPFPGSSHWQQYVNQDSQQTLVSKKSIKYNAKQLELQSKIIMFHNVNKHWRAQLDRPLEETIQSRLGLSIRAPSGLHQGTGGPLGVKQGFLGCLCQ